MKKQEIKGQEKDRLPGKSGKDHRDGVSPGHQDVQHRPSIRHGLYKIQEPMGRTRWDTGRRGPGSQGRRCECCPEILRLYEPVQRTGGF